MAPLLPEANGDRGGEEMAGSGAGSLPEEQVQRDRGFRRFNGSRTAGTPLRGLQGRLDAAGFRDAATLARCLLQQGFVETAELCMLAPDQFGELKATLRSEGLSAAGGGVSGHESMSRSQLWPSRGVSLDSLVTVRANDASCIRVATVSQSPLASRGGTCQTSVADVAPIVLVQPLNRSMDALVASPLG